VIARLQRQARRRAVPTDDRSQGGYILMAVLAAIALTGLTIGALFGLMMTTMRVTAAQERSARESRAADGAVVSAINNVRLNRTDPIDPCSPGVPGSAGLIVPFDDVSGPVKVTCTPAPDQLGPSGGDIDLVGTDYAGSISDWRTAWPWAAAPVDAAALASAAPSLLHTGGQALKFNGSVTSNGGIAAVRSDAASTPAIDVRSGAALQPVAGLGGSGTSCGVLSGPGVKPSTAVVSTAGVTCGDPTVAATATVQNYAINPAVQTPTATCPATAVVELLPGTYDRDAVATLNTWFNGSLPSCRGKTFHFTPGIYSFDANARSGPAADKFALIFNDATASFVFGTPSGWGGAGATAANFPRACVAGGPGASIVVSGRTEFRHLGGRMAVCPYTSPEGRAWPALLQSRTVPTAVTVNTPTSSQFRDSAGRPDGLISGSSTAAARRTIGCDMPAKGFLNFDPAYCSQTASFSIRLATPASGPVTSLPFRITGDETNYNVTLMSARKASFSLALAGGGTCGVQDLDGAPDDSRTATYDLMAASGTCDTTITEASLLDGATVTVTFKYDYVGLCPIPFGTCAVNAQTLAIWQLSAAIDVWQGVAGSVSPTPPSPASDWSDLDAVRLDDTQVAHAEICPIAAESVCGGPWNVPYERSFDMAAFGNPADPPTVSPDAVIDSLGVTIRQLGPKGPGLNTASLPGTTTLSLTLKDTTVCSRTFTNVANMTGDTFYSLMDQGSVNCGAAVLSADQLVGSNVIGSSLRVAYRIDCTGIQVPIGPDCLFIEPVAIQQVALNATSNSFTGDVTEARISVDSAGGRSANFFGPAHLPHSSLDIFWTGTASGASIFGGDVQLHSLGSRMAAGASADVVCCTAASAEVRRVTLTAQIDGRPRVSATVSINRTTGALEVLEWVRCGRNGACSIAP